MLGILRPIVALSTRSLSCAVAYLSILLLALAMSCATHAATFPDPSSSYWLSNSFLKDDQVLAVDPSNKLVMANRATDKRQMWKFISLGNGYFRIANDALGADMSIDSDPQAPNIRKTGNYSGQYWRLIEVGNGFYRLSNMYQQAKSLDTFGSVPHAPFLGNTGNYSGQLWKLTPIPNSTPQQSASLTETVITGTVTLPQSNTQSTTSDPSIRPSTEGTLVVGSGPNLPTTSNGSDLTVGGCFANPAICNVGTASNDPYPNFHGSLKCPLINPGPPPRMSLPCSEYLSPARPLPNIRPKGVACKGQSPPGYADPFFDPRNGGECWVCPVGYERGFTAVPVTAPNACAGVFLWNYPQYPEPGLYALLFDRSGKLSELGRVAFGNKRLIARLIKLGSNNNSKGEEALWNEFVATPWRSTAFKTVAFMSAMSLAKSGRTDGLEAFREYISARRRYDYAEGLTIYNKWRQIDDFYRTEALRQALKSGGGIPLPGTFMGDSGKVSADILGTSPPDIAADLKAVFAPDAAGDEFLRTLVQVRTLAKPGELGGDPGSQVDAALDIGQFVIDTWNAIPWGNIEPPGAFDKVGLGLQFVSNGIELYKAIKTLEAQAEGAKAMTEWGKIASEPVDLKAMASDPKQFFDLAMHWARATSPYAGGKQLGSGPIMSCPAEWRAACESMTKLAGPIAPQRSYSATPMTTFEKQVANLDPYKAEGGPLTLLNCSGGAINVNIFNQADSSYLVAHNSKIVNTGSWSNLVCASPSCRLQIGNVKTGALTGYQVFIGGAVRATNKLANSLGCNAFVR